MDTASSQQQQAVQLSSSSAGRLSGKPWKPTKSASRRSHLADSVKTKRWEDRMEQSKKAAAVKMLENELAAEKKAVIARRREVTQERKRLAEERQRLAADKATMGARKAARLRRKAGRSKKINH